MKKIKRGDIFYANLDPTVGSEQSGIRPVVILQNDKISKSSPTVIVAPVSTKTDKKTITHIYIKQFDKIRHNSIILVEQLRTIDKSRLKAYVCTLNNRQIGNVNKALKIVLNIK